MKKLKYKVGDRVIGIKNDPVFPDRLIIGKIGKIVQCRENRTYCYKVKFSEKIRIMEDNELGFIDLVAEYQIETYLTKLKLKKLLKD